MPDNKQMIIAESIKAGKGRLETRNVLISQGESSAGFDELYTAGLSQLGMSEPKQAMSTHIQTTGEMPLGTSPRREQARTSAKRKSIFVLVIILLVSIGFVGIAVSTAWPIIQRDFFPSTYDSSVGTTSSQTGATYTDDLFKAKVEATEASVSVYKGRMGSYDGLCKDISVVPPLQCTQVGENYSIFTALSNRTYYCMDKSGFKGSVENKPGNNGLCK